MYTYTGECGAYMRSSCCWSLAFGSNFVYEAYMNFVYEAYMSVYTYTGECDAYMAMYTYAGIQQTPQEARKCVYVYRRMCSLTTECVLLLQNVFSYYRMCSLTIGIQQTAQEAHKMLLELGIWDEFTNPWCALCVCVCVCVCVRARVRVCVCVCVYVCV